MIGSARRSGLNPPKGNAISAGRQGGVGSHTACTRLNPPKGNAISAEGVEEASMWSTWKSQSPEGERHLCRRCSFDALVLGSACLNPPKGNAISAEVKPARSGRPRGFVSIPRRGTPSLQNRDEHSSYYRGIVSIPRRGTPSLQVVSIGPHRRRPVLSQSPEGERHLCRCRGSP